MCVIIDACVIPKVFGSSSVDYAPVRNWITQGKGKMVLGGTKYDTELMGVSRYLRVLRELERQRKLVRISNRLVDAAERNLLMKVKSKNFDDPHIIALVDESGCRIVCTDDSRSDKYLKNKDLYAKAKRPYVYRSAKHHVHLLCNKNIIAACRK